MLRFIFNINTMETKLLKTIGILSLLVVITTISVGAQESLYADFRQEGITLTNPKNEVVDGKSYTIFEINSDKEGDFCVNFWLIPAKYADGSYSVYDVLVNDLFAGKIVSQRGNWQAIGLSGNEKIKLQRGLNRIAVVGIAPEVPEVEYVRLAKKEDAVAISSKNYDSYLASARSAEENNSRHLMSSKVQFASLLRDSLAKLNLEILKMKTMKSLRSTISPVKNFPFQYTFYKKIHIIPTKAEIFITSESKSIHVLEFFSEGAEQLTLVRRSERAQNKEGKYNELATIRVQGLSEGDYYIKVRIYQNFNSGVANVNVDGRYYYENVPIYSAGIPMIQESGVTYSTFTKNSTSNPFMWIEGGSNERPGYIVAYNDDRNDPHSNKYSLKPSDSYVRENFYMPTLAVLLTASKSNDPPGKCDVYMKVSDQDVIASAFRSNENKIRNGTLENICDIDDVKVYPNPIKANSILSVSSGDNIKKIEIFDMSGQLKIWKDVQGTQAEVNLSESNLFTSGVYIMRVETDSKAITKKILIEK